MKRLGLLVPVVTPCDRKGRPDTEALKSVCDDMLSAGFHGIFVCGSTGRGPWFGREDKAKICRAAADHIGSNIPLFAGCIASGLDDMLENSRLMADAGAQNAVLTCPGYFGYNQQEIERIFLKFADNSPLPVMIYDIPAFTGAKLDVEMVNRLAKHQNVIGFKDSTADFDHFKSLLNILGELDDFILIQGKENLLADSILAGASGITVSLLHIDPRPFVALYNAAVAGDTELAQKIQLKITEVMQIVVDNFKRCPEISSIFHLLGYCLKKRGVCNNILLEHEIDCPDWIAKQAEKTLQISASALE